MEQTTCHIPQSFKKMTRRRESLKFGHYGD